MSKPTLSKVKKIKPMLVKDQSEKIIKIKKKNMNVYSFTELVELLEEKYKLS